MSKDGFSELLERAKCGESYASELLVEAYMPLVTKHSYVDGVLDEDCRQFLLVRFLIAIKKFKS